MKYTLLTMFSVNLLLKLVISSSAAMMWSLIHVLQVFRYILFINIKMPRMVSTLMQYLAVVVGEVDEMEEAVPDIFNSYIIDGESLNSSITLYPKFQDNGNFHDIIILGYDSPFLTILFSKQMTIILLSTIISISAIVIGVRVFKNYPMITNKLNSIWSSLFYNTPLRTLTELYIEISMGFFLNALNVSCSLHL